MLTLELMGVAVLMVILVVMIVVVVGGAVDALGYRLGGERKSRNAVVIELRRGGRGGRIRLFLFPRERRRRRRRRRRGGCAVPRSLS